MSPDCMPQNENAGKPCSIGEALCGRLERECGLGDPEDAEVLDEVAREIEALENVVRKARALCECDVLTQDLWDDLREALQGIRK